MIIIRAMDPYELLWMVLLIVVVLGELATIGLTCIWFAAGALAALPRLAMASLKNPLQKFIIHFLKTFNHHPGARITLFRKCRICIGSHRHMRTDCRLNPGICRRNQEDFLCMKFPHSKRFFRYVFHRKYRKVCGQLQRIPFFLLIDQCL